MGHADSPELLANMVVGGQLIGWKSGNHRRPPATEVGRFGIRANAIRPAAATFRHRRRAPTRIHDRTR